MEIYASAVRKGLRRHRSSGRAFQSEEVEKLASYNNCGLLLLKRNNMEIEAFILVLCSDCSGSK